MLPKYNPFLFLFSLILTNIQYRYPILYYYHMDKTSSYTFPISYSLEESHNIPTPSKRAKLYNIDLIKPNAIVTSVLSQSKMTGSRNQSPCKSTNSKFISFKNTTTFGQSKQQPIAIS